MPLLTVRDQFPPTPRRVLVAGTAGSGKTTLADRVAVAWDLPRIELDSLYHGENWAPRPTFAAEVAEFAAQPRWVTEWQYTSLLGPLLSDRADLVLWLDHPRWRVMSQVVSRTVRRRLLNVELWNGNREGPLRSAFTDPDHVIRWAWRTQGQPAQRVAEVLARRPEVSVVRICGRRESNFWIRTHLTLAPHRRAPDR